MVTFTDTDARIVRELQRDLGVVLQRANEQRVEAALAVFALARCAKNLLAFYPPAARSALLEAIVPFLEGVGDEKITLLKM